MEGEDPDCEIEPASDSDEDIRELQFFNELVQDIKEWLHYCQIAHSDARR